MVDYLAYYELHVEDKTYPTYTIIAGKNTDDVFEKMGQAYR